jgi:very-short-patch-repair endonuclease
VGVDIHDLQKEEDERREKVLSAMGLRIVRFQNDEVVRELSTVMGKIRQSCAMSSDDKLGESNK